MSKKAFLLVFAIAFLALSPFFVVAQISVSPQLSVDAQINSLVSKGDTLIVCGAFGHVGISTGGAALVAVNSDKVNTNFPKIIGTINCSTPDGNGGFYIYGSYRHPDESDVSGSDRIEHVQSDLSWESGFQLTVNSVFKLNTLLYNNGILYIGGGMVNQISGQNVGNLSAVDVKTKQLVPWIPNVPNTSGKVTGIYVAQNTLYIIGDFKTVGSVSRSDAAAIELNTGKIKPWNPTFGSGYNDIAFYKDKIVLAGGFGDASFDNHACALLDTLTGQSVNFIFDRNSLYWAAGVSHVALKGDTLFAASAGTFDTRITAVDLAHGNNILWKKFFNMTALANGLLLSGNYLITGGSGFSAVYKTNAANQNDADIERLVSGPIMLATNNGDLQSWNPSPGGLITNDVNTLSSSAGNIFLGGTFSLMNAQKRYGIFMMNVKTESILPLNLSLDYFSHEVNSIKLIDTTIYITGDFANANGQNVSASVLSVGLNSGNILPWHPPYMGNAWASEANDKYLFVAGSLTDPGNSSRTNLMAIDRKTAQIINWSPSPDNQISTNSLSILNNRLYVGGKFQNIAGQSRNRIASFDLGSLTLTGWQPPIGVSTTVTALKSSGKSIWVGVNDFTQLLMELDTVTGATITNVTKGLLGSGNLNAITIAGSYVIGGGYFHMSSNSCNNLIVYDTSSKQIYPPTSFCETFDNKINAVTVSKNDLYTGGNFLITNSTANTSYLDGFRFNPGFFSNNKDSTYTYFPNSGGNGGDVTVNFYSLGIKSGTHVKLTAIGHPDIVVPDSLVTYPQAGQMEISLNLRNTAAGVYNIVLTNSAGDVDFPNGFTVQEFVKPSFDVEILGASAVRTGQPTLFNVALKNKGNADARATPLWLVTSANLTVKYQVPVFTRDSISADTATSLIIDSLDGHAFKGRVQIVLIPQILEGEVYSLPLQVTSSGGDFYIKAMAADPLMQSPFNKETGECLEAAVSAAADKIPDLVAKTLSRPLSQLETCGAGLAATMEKMLGAGITSQNKKGGKLVYDLVKPAAYWGLDCAFLAFSEEEIAASLAASLLQDLWELKKAYDHGSEIDEKCSKLFPDNNKSHSAEKNGSSSSSYDPNEKTGIGLSAKHYVTSLTPLQYGIGFENRPDASADAQVVVVTDTLDQTKVDLNTFQFNSYQLGKQIKTIAPGRSACNEYLDLRPAKNLILQVSGTLDKSSGILSVTFSSLDPATMKLSSNALLGFLPPDTDKISGQASVYYTVQPLAGLADQTRIDNRAVIRFDYNTPINTATWSNLIDVKPPVSKIVALPDSSKGTQLKLSWAGTDGGSGVAGYSIYYSTNGGPFVSYLTNTSTLSASFSGKVDSTYAFYSVAKDSLGNQEQKSSYDTKTLMIKAVQKMTFPAPGVKSYNDMDFAGGASANSGLPVIYSSSNPSVITVAGVNLHIAGIGKATIKAWQPGNDGYYPSDTLTQEIQVRFTLPVNNFAISSVSESCKGSGNGEIHISAVSKQHYMAAITGATNTNLSFTDSLSVNHLSSGVYNICITIPDYPDYQQCYTVNITEPKDLSVYSTVDNANGQLSLSLTGGSKYIITLNGTSYATSASNFSAPLQEGQNSLSVSTDKPCQGTYQNTVNLPGGISAFPNPVHQLLEVTVSNDQSTTAALTVVTLYGKTVLTETKRLNNGKCTVDLSSLENGMYVLKVITVQSEKRIKIIKQ